MKNLLNSLKIKNNEDKNKTEEEKNKIKEEKNIEKKIDEAINKIKNINLHNLNIINDLIHKTKNQLDLIITYDKLFIYDFFDL